MSFLPSGAERRPIMLLALGAFALGTDAFVISGVLPLMARDLNVSLAVAGLLITAFSGVYAVAGPVLAVVTGNMCRRRLMLTALTIFVIANVLAAAAPDYAVLVLARVLAAAGAALYTPAAAATATTLAKPAERGRALATVLGGLTIASAVGVPIGTLIGTNISWRVTFVFVAVLGLVALAGLARALGPIPASGTASLRERASVARIPGVRPALGAMALSIGGQFILYTYLAWFAGRVGGVTGGALSLIYLLWGIAAIISNFSGGVLIDRISPVRVAVLSVVGQVVLFAGLGLTAAVTSRGAYSIGILVTLWGVVGWLFYPAMQKLLAGASGARAAIALSLGASSVYGGQAIAGVVGGLLLRHGPASLGFVAALCQALALGLLAVTARRLVTARAPAQAPVPVAADRRRLAGIGRATRGRSAGFWDR
jgi:MFS transporter, DHA1 family, inner membrane transport protein